MKKLFRWLHGLLPKRLSKHAAGSPTTRSHAQPNISAQQATVVVPPIPPTHTGPAAMQALDTLWSNVNNITRTIQQGTPLWHAGVVGPARPVSSNQIIWTSDHRAGALDYKGFANMDAKDLGVQAYLTEFHSSKDLDLADFGGASLSGFTITYCSGAHRDLNAALGAWLSYRQLDGLTNVNGGKDEVVILDSVNLLIAKSYTPI